MYASVAARSAVWLQARIGIEFVSGVRAPNRRSSLDAKRAISIISIPTTG